MLFYSWLLLFSLALAIALPLDKWGQIINPKENEPAKKNYSFTHEINELLSSPSRHMISRSDSREAAGAYVPREEKRENRTVPFGINLCECRSDAV